MYNNEYENVQVKCDWTAINEYVFSVLNDDAELYEMAAEIFDETDIKKLVQRVAETYSDGIVGADIYEEGETVDYICLEQYLYLLNEEEKEREQYKKELE